ncbi:MULTISPECIES: hypothetical protein [Thalassospira]|uniref:hypothetical protein n=1 Tax=Thalassospira TaxID=168934 RepID=UPI001055F978|nr:MULTISPECIES: hypothetical protein [Thalassospira]
MKSKEEFPIIQTSFRLDNETHLKVGRMYEALKAQAQPAKYPVPSIAVMFGYLLNRSIVWIKQNNIELARLDVDPQVTLMIKLLKSDHDWLENVRVPASEKQIVYAQKLALEHGVMVPENAKKDTEICADFIAQYAPNQRKINQHKAISIPKYALVAAAMNLAYDMLSSQEVTNGIYEWPVYRQLYDQN